MTLLLMMDDGDSRVAFSIDRFQPSGLFCFVLTSGPNRVNKIIMSQSEHVRISVNNIVIPGSPWAHAVIEGKNTTHTLKITINTTPHHPYHCTNR